MKQSKEGEKQRPVTPLSNETTPVGIWSSLASMERFMPRALVNDTDLTHRATNTDKDRSIAQLIVAVFLLSLATVGIQAYSYHQMAFTQELKNYVVFLYVAAYLFAFIALASFKFLHRSTSLLSNSYAAFTLLLTLGIHGLTGLTMQSPIVPLYFFIPAWAFLSCSSRSGILWSLVVAGVFVMTTFIAPLQLSFPNIIPADSLASAHLTNSLSAIALIGFCLYAHQGSFLALTDQLDEDRLLYAHKAQHDPLTGLFNREQFDLRLQEALLGVTHRQQNAALIYIDLNDFKAVNDTHGHQVGDSVLQIAAQRIDKVVRESDTTARLGGDEFGIVLPNLQDQKSVMRIVRQLEETLANPMRIDDLSLEISGSVGMAIAPENGYDAGSLTRYADRNMYDAKSAKARLKLVQAG